MCQYCNFTLVSLHTVYRFCTFVNLFFSCLFSLQINALIVLRKPVQRTYAFFFIKEVSRTMSPLTMQKDVNDMCNFRPVPVGYYIASYNSMMFFSSYCKHTRCLTLLGCCSNTPRSPISEPIP